MIDLSPILEAPISPLDVVRALGLKVARGSGPYKAIVSCPIHAEKTPSCVVASRDGRIVFRCHGCGEGGDLLGLVAAVHRLDVARDFRRVAGSRPTWSASASPMMRGRTRPTDARGRALLGVRPPSSSSLPAWV